MRVLNKYRDDCSGAIYIGRGSPWGNPFPLADVKPKDRKAERERIMVIYNDWIKTQPALMERMRAELTGKDLVCFCAPSLCHGETIVKICNNEPF